MSFDFSFSKNESAVRNIRRPLSPWEIHEVKFTGAEVKEIQGKKDPSQTYKILNINFENEDGYFSVNQFFPKTGDDQRREYDGSNGGKIQMPSNFEVFKAILSQTMQVLLDPTLLGRFQTASASFKTIDDMVNSFVKIINTVKGKETKLKLVGRNRDGKVVADIPRLVAINKEGQAWISDNYIGDKLFFSDYEESQKNKFKSSTPTKMPSDPLNIVEPEQKSDDNEFDLESLL